MTLPHGTGLQPRRVGAVVRLGEAEAAELLTQGDRREPLLLLLLGAELEDRLAAQAHRHRDDAAHRGVGPAELLHPDAVGDVVATDPAVLLGDRQAEEAELTELGDDAGADRLGP